MDSFSDKPHSFREETPWGSFFVLIIMVICGLLVGQSLGLACVFLIYNFSLTALQNVIMDPITFPEARMPMYIVQGFTAVGAFIVTPFLYIQYWVQSSPSVFFLKRPVSSSIVVSIFFIVISFMFVNSVFVEWNEQLTLPEFMKNFENWAYEKEQQAKQLTVFLTRFNNVGQFLLGILIIAVIPAVGEELLFRGLIQNQMHAITKNIHVAIWITGFLFSAIHFQFYGLIPRMILGALFGYMYYWSGKLIVPIIAHFINNAFTLTMLYLFQLRTIDYDLETETSVPWYIATFGLVAGSILLFKFRAYYRQQKVVDE